MELLGPTGLDCARAASAGLVRIHWAWGFGVWNSWFEGFGVFGMYARDLPAELEVQVQEVEFSQIAGSASRKGIRLLSRASLTTKWF